MDRDRTFRIGISGSYGGLNLGDEAILASMLDQLESVPAKITVFTRDPEDTIRRHGVGEAVPVRELTRDESKRIVECLDLLILGGGGILFDGEAEHFLREVQLAREAGVPVFVYAISAGPLETQSARELVRDELNQVDVITVRDRHARRLLEGIGVRTEMTVTADPAVLLEPEPLSQTAIDNEGLDDEGPLVGFSVREPGPAAPDIDVDHYHGLIANAADYLISRIGAKVVFVPMEKRKMDVQHSHAVVSRMKHAERASVLKGDYTSAQLAGVIGRLNLAIGMRLHFLIFAAIQRVPFVALPYAPKVEGFLEELGIEGTSLKTVSTGVLIADIDRCWDHRESLRRRIGESIVALQDKARLNHRLLVELLERVSSSDRKEV